MKIVLWIGNDSNQKALANKIHAIMPVAGIITETRQIKRKITLPKLAGKAIEKIFLPSIAKAWFGMKRYYDERFKNYPDTKMLDVENINSDAAFNFTSEIDPDLVIVSGTRLIKEKMLSIKPRIGILNLHTGLSPYIKGGPNCTNWCIATNQFHLIGNTVMWIDAGIDSGNIVTTELTQFNGDENLPDVHIKVMEHAHNLYINAIQQLAKGVNSSVKQDSISKGITYYTKQWGLKEKFALVRNFKKFSKTINADNTVKLKEAITTIKI